MIFCEKCFIRMILAHNKNTIKIALTLMDKNGLYAKWFIHHKEARNLIWNNCLTNLRKKII